MRTDDRMLRAPVRADLPWYVERAPAGTLRIGEDALILEGRGTRISIPLATIRRASVETTLGVLPALHVWHIVEGQETLSRFEFGQEQEEEPQRKAGSGLAERIGPGAARTAALGLEGGLRALGGGLGQGMRTARQAVEGVVRQEEYQAWPAAIARAQEAAKRRSRPVASASPSTRATPPPETPNSVPLDARVPAGDAAATLAWFHQTVVGWIAASGRRARELGIAGVPVIQPWYPLDSPVCRIVVAGEFSRGKSTLINALFGIHGELALPTGMTPTTPLACAIRVARVGETDGATISYRTARPPRELTLDDFRAQVRLAEAGGEPEDGGADQALHLDEARRVEVRVTGAYLPAGVEIEDTPGLNEQAGRSAGALAALGRADLVLFVLAADQLLSELEQDVLGRVLVQGHHRNLIVLVNFWDSIDDEAQRAILRQRVETLLAGLPSLPGSEGRAAIHYVSALQAARAQRQHKAAPEDSGIPAVRALLRDLLGSESSMLLLRARSGRALRYAELLHAAVVRGGAELALEGTAATVPLDAWQQAVSAATRLIDGMRGAVEGAITRTLADVRAQERPGLLRAREMLRPAAVSSSRVALQDARRVLLVELTAAASEVAVAAQEAVDLVIAQARAAFPARGLPAPLLQARVEQPAIAIPVDALVEALAVLIEDAAEMLRESVLTRVDAQHALLQQELRALATKQERVMPTTPEQGAERAERLRQVRALEDDLTRLVGLLAPLARR